MKFCSECGSAVSHRVPDGDNRPRYVCDDCEVIHYHNPRVVTGCLLNHGDRVLLCKRAIEPRAGLWTLPAGFLENGETAQEGALRETREEANASARIHGIYTLFSLPHISQIYMFFRGELTDLDFHPGEESLEVELFHEADIPWDTLAFPVIGRTLKHYFEDRQTGDFAVRHEDIIVHRKPGTFR